MKLELNDQLRILLAGALIAATSGFVVALAGQAHWKEQIDFMEKQNDKRISAIKGQHTKEINRLRSACIHLYVIEKKIDLLISTKGKQ